MGGKEEVGWRVGKEKRQWVERSEGGQEERMIVTYNTNWLLQSTQFKHTCVFAEVSAVAAVLLEKKNIVKLFNNFYSSKQATIDSYLQGGLENIKHVNKLKLHAKVFSQTS